MSLGASSNLGIQGIYGERAGRTTVPTVRPKEGGWRHWRVSCMGSELRLSSTVPPPPPPPHWGSSLRTLCSFAACSWLSVKLCYATRLLMGLNVQLQPHPNAIDNFKKTKWSGRVTVRLRGVYGIGSAGPHATKKHNDCASWRAFNGSLPKPKRFPCPFCFKMCTL